MKTARTLGLSVIISALLLAGCGLNYPVFSSRGTESSVTISAYKAEDGDFSEMNYIIVEEGDVVVVQSSLENGQLQIDFLEAEVLDPRGDNEEVIAGELAYRVVADQENREELGMDNGYYVLKITAIGRTDGKVTILTQKEEGE